MGFIHIEDKEGWDTELSKIPGDKLVVVDFTATWCGPCKMISPIFEALSVKYPGVSFFKVDVDECPDIAGMYEVSAMPTFVFLKNRKEIDRLRGADPNALEQKVKTLGGPNATQSSGFTGSGQRLGFNADATGTQGAGSASLGGWLGSWLGSGTSNPTQSESTNVVDHENAAKASLNTDPNLPITKIQVRLADGSKFTVEVNLSSPISKIREFIRLARPDHADKEFSLNTTINFPAKEITDETVSIEDAGLANSVLVQKPKI